MISMPVFVCGYKLIAILLLASYFLGSIPFGLILTKLAGHGDIREFGSGNIGATNVLRKSGKVIALLTLIVDGGKGVLAIYIAEKFCGDYLVLILVGVVAILGHIFPVWLDFKGGKGVATAFAVFLMLVPTLGMLVCIIWLITLAVSRISAVAALMSFAIVPVLTYFITYDTRLVLAFSFISTVVILRHTSNIKQLLS